MSFKRDGIPLASFLTFMNIWVAVLYGPSLWQAWGGAPLARIGILLLAGGATFTLMNVWSLTLGHPTFCLPCPPSDEVMTVNPEAADV
jgi:hypothetical protein